MYDPCQGLQAVYDTWCRPVEKVRVNDKDAIVSDRRQTLIVSPLGTHLFEVRFFGHGSDDNDFRLERQDLFPAEPGVRRRTVSKILSPSRNDQFVNNGVRSG